MRVAVVTPEGIGKVHTVATPPNPTTAIRAMTDLITRMDVQVESVYGGIPAVVTSDGSVESATNLPSWDGFPFGRALQKALGVPVSVRNDAELAGLGEAVYGAGKDMHDVAYLGLGTGVGTSHVVRRKIDPASSGGEVRMKIITLTDGSTLEKRLGGHSLFLRYGMHPEKLPHTVWGKLTHYLVEGIANEVHLWSPDVVVLGGSLVNDANGFRVADVEDALRIHFPDITVPVRRAALKDAAGLYGAKVWLESELAASAASS
jgi:predicted NBD/HSP70 family sugar kinase